MKRYLPLFLPILFLSCAKDEKNYSDYIPDDTFSGYVIEIPWYGKNGFTSKILDVHEKHEEFYGQFWKAMKEESLWNYANNPNTEIYRFTYLRTFLQPVCIRIEKKEDKIFAVGKITSGRGGYDPGYLEISEKKELSESDFKILRNKIIDSGYYNYPSYSGNRGCDGTTWIIESVYDGTYRYVNYHGHEEGEPLRGLGMEFMKLIGWPYDERTFY